MAVKWLVLVVLLALLPGCAGFGVATYGKHEAAREEFGLASERNDFSFDVQTYAPEEVTSLWGEPDRRDVSGECTVFGFKKGTSWSGGGVFVGIVPIPVAVPNGNYWNYIYFRDGESVGAVVEYGEVKDAVGVFCGSNEWTSGVEGDVNAPPKSAKESIKEWCDTAA